MVGKPMTGTSEEMDAGGLLHSVVPRSMGMYGIQVIALKGWGINLRAQRTFLLYKSPGEKG